ncbi:site-specific DNA-methyltransferase [Serratia liquefaciens]|uniref:site-specific DNA-methyltransferase n=1 Tax=Serratia liquefaciens TaxID=614 RepID=UPI003808CF22
MSKFNELVTKLREVFQIDRPELDFGVYRILNARADEINEYLEKRLKEKVEQALASGSAANIGQLKDDLKKAEQAATDAGFGPAESPKVKELKAKITQASSGSAEHENAVFSHLLTFFSRYYDNGDFISQRRYKGDTYGIPYAGEEVMLHWANKDQYYTKSGENFSNYSFKLDDGRVVHFRLVAADTAKDNRKDNDKERRFVLVEQKIITRIDDEGEEYEEEILPVEEVIKKDSGSNETKELIIRFEYKAMPKGSKQDKLVEAAVSAVLANNAVASRWLDLSKREPTEKNPKRTLLEKHLTNYTTKNTADYFIHKNLGKFLRGELDFYIKNEVMHLDDVQNAEAFSDIEKNLRMIQCLRSIALDLIKFLAQLEDFQKKLWTKKKFVVSSYYCFTVNMINSEHYESIVKNRMQWDQWRNLGVWNEVINGEVSDLDNLKHLVVDLSLFSSQTASEILNSMEDISDKLDGVIINSDNSSALQLLGAKYANKVDMIYIDPPYNTGLGDFSYKDKFLHSSWATLLSQSSLYAEKLMTDVAPFWITLDDGEFHRAKLIVEQESGFNFISSLSWQKVYSPRMDAKQFSNSIDYLLVFNKNKDWIPEKLDIEPDLKQFPFRDHEERHYRSDPLRKWGKNSLRADRPNLWYGIKAPNGEVVYPIKPDGTEGYWRWKEEKVKAQYEHLDWLDKGHGLQPYLRQYADKSTKRPIETLWPYQLAGSTHESSEELKALFGYMSFPTPKPTKLIKMCMHSIKSDCLVLDYFSGSGTTAHAVMELNREDGGKRKYILVEQGEYFDFVLKPRIQKIAFSSSWKNGKPNDKSGITHCFKVLKLESYEDTLNNLELKNPKVDLFDNNPELKDDYLLNYMLNVESRGSLLSTDDFKKPFDYTMKIAVDSAGAFEEQKVDLVETFNYLIGLTVKHINAQPERGFVTVTGNLPSGETCLVLWRDCEKVDYEGLKKLCDKLEINPADNEFDVVYINGDHNIPTVLTQTAEEGGETRVLKLRQIEPEFLERMFAEEEI